MPSKSQNQSVGFAVTTLSLKDLITIVSVAVSLAVAWGMFNTRVALLEGEFLNIQKSIDQSAQTTDALSKRVRTLEDRQQNNELMLDQVYQILHKPSPLRRSDIR